MEFKSLEDPISHFSFLVNSIQNNAKNDSNKKVIIFCLGGMVQKNKKE